MDLWWQGHFLRIVVSITAEGRRGIFFSTDVTMAPELILTAYGFRFRIEMDFKSLVHTMFGFGYRFWMKTMTRIERWGGDQFLHRATPAYRAAVARKVEAYERFVNIAGMAMGMLQLLALMAKDLAGTSGLYFRTMPRSGIPSVLAVRCTLQGLVFRLFRRNDPRPLLAQILAERDRPEGADHPLQVAA